MHLHTRVNKPCIYKKKIFPNELHIKNIVYKSSLNYPFLFFIFKKKTKLHFLKQKKKKDLRTLTNILIDGRRVEKFHHLHQQMNHT